MKPGGSPLKPIILNQSENSEFLYIQLYEAIKCDILSGAMTAGEKLPSLRSLSKELGISLTTTELAYNQLLVEGYVTSKPQSGYYVAAINPEGGSITGLKEKSVPANLDDYTFDETPYITDLSCFDFVKWKKCAARVFNDYSGLLLFESDPQGEPALRYEISKYIYRFRGVTASPDRIVIGAGTQQITSHLSRILLKMGISHVSLEAPGYLPVQSMFRDAGFNVSHIPVAKDGIDISKLPANISSAVYVSPSNQFPTGAVMPVGRRYELLDWATENDSIIIEDDYDSELRYFGKPVPAMQGLDKHNRVVYLGLVYPLPGGKDFLYGTSGGNGRDFQEHKKQVYTNLFQIGTADTGSVYGGRLLLYRHKKTAQSVCAEASGSLAGLRPVCTAHGGPG